MKTLSWLYLSLLASLLLTGCQNPINGAQESNVPSDHRPGVGSHAPVANNISPASFDADTQSGAITLSYTDANGDKATSCDISNLSHVSISQACACDGAGVCTVKVTGVTHYNGAASFDYTVTANGATSNTARASLMINLVKSLALNFTTASLDSAITYTRSGGGTRTNSAGNLETLAFNTPRFDYDPNTNVINGLLIEESRQNLLAFSEGFDQNYWSKTRGSVTADATVAPDGTTTADKWVEDNSNGQHYIRNTTLTKAASNLTYSWTMYAKAGERTQILVSMSNSALTQNASAVFTLTGAGSISNSSNTASWSAATKSITSLPNDWYRLSMTSTSDTSTNIIVLTYLFNGATSAYLGDGSSGAYIWGAQLEQASTATSYIPAKNMLLRSEELDQSWTLASLNTFGSGSVADSNGTLAPDGTQTADYITDNTVPSVHQARQSVSTPAVSQTFTLSFYAKKGTRDLAQGAIVDHVSAGNSVSAIFDLTNGTVGSISNNGATNGGSGATASITAAGNDWYRCVVTGQPNSTATTSVRAAIGIVNGAGLTSYVGDGSGFYVWGAQFEPGSSASTYIKTTTSAVREADQAAISTLGSWFDSAAGSIFSEVKLRTAPASGVLANTFGFTDGSANNVISQYYTATGAGKRVVNAGVQQTDATVTFAPSGTSRLTSAYQNNDLQISESGTLGTASGVCMLPTVDRLYLGSDGSTNYLNGWLRNLDYYPSRVTDSQLNSFSQ